MASVLQYLHLAESNQRFLKLREKTINQQVHKNPSCHMICLPNPQILPSILDVFCWYMTFRSLNLRESVTPRKPVNTDSKDVHICCTCKTSWHNMHQKKSHANVQVYRGYPVFSFLVKLFLREGLVVVKPLRRYVDLVIAPAKLEAIPPCTSALWYQLYPE